MEVVTIIILPPLFPLCSYFRQLGDLDESLEVDHLFGSIEEVLKPGGQKKNKPNFNIHLTFMHMCYTYSAGSILFLHSITLCFINSFDFVTLLLDCDKERQIPWSSF